MNKKLYSIMLNFTIDLIYLINISIISHKKTHEFNINQIHEFFKHSTTN